MTRKQRLPILCGPIAVLVLTLIGCSTESSSTTPEDKQLVLHNDSFVDSFLLTQDELHRWRFTPDEFVVEGFQEPLPTQLASLLVEADSPDFASPFRISGRWELLDNGHTLWLTELDADQAEIRPEVRLQVQTKGHETVIIEGLSYRLAPSLPLREILPIRIYTAELEEVLRGDLLRVREKGQSRIVQLDGIICPGKDEPFGADAIRRCAKLLGDASVFVKVYRVDGEGRDIAQVWGPNYQYVNVKLLNAGLAWHDKRQSSDWVYATSEDEARAQGRGLWVQQAPVPPWISPVTE